MGTEITRTGGAGDLGGVERVELSTIAQRVREGLKRTANDIIAIGADLIRAKALLGHGGFGPWLDQEFALSRRTAEQFMAAARRFRDRPEAVSHLPVGAVLELSAPSVPDELVDRVLSGEVRASVSAIRAERSVDRVDDRSETVASSFFDFIRRYRGTSVDLAAAIAAQALRRWDDPDYRAWFATCLGIAAEMVEDNKETRFRLLQTTRGTAREIKERWEASTDA
jgi:hypothetical protein